MKKVFAAILIVAVIGVGSLFAASIVNSGANSSMYDYFGFNLGFGITNESYDYTQGVTRTDKGYQLAFSVNEKFVLLIWKVTLRAQSDYFSQKESYYLQVMLAVHLFGYF